MSSAEGLRDSFSEVGTTEMGKRFVGRVIGGRHYIESDAIRLRSKLERVWLTCRMVTVLVLR